MNVDSAAGSGRAEEADIVWGWATVEEGSAGYTTAAERGFVG